MNLLFGNILNKLKIEIEFVNIHFLNLFYQQKFFFFFPKTFLKTYFKRQLNKKVCVIVINSPTDKSPFNWDRSYYFESIRKRKYSLRIRVPWVLLIFTHFTVLFFNRNFAHRNVWCYLKSIKSIGENEHFLPEIINFQELESFSLDGKIGFISRVSFTGNYRWITGVVTSWYKLKIR